MTWQSCGGGGLGRGLRDLFEDGTPLADGFIRAQHHGEGTQHEHDGAPRGGLGENVGRAARAESRLAAGTAEGAGEVRGFAALQQDNHN